MSCSSSQTLQDDISLSEKGCREKHKDSASRRNWNCTINKIRRHLVWKTLKKKIGCALNLFLFLHALWNGSIAYYQNCAIGKLPIASQRSNMNAWKISRPKAGVRCRQKGKAYAKALRQEIMRSVWNQRAKGTQHKEREKVLKEVAEIDKGILARAYGTWSTLIN